MRNRILSLVAVAGFATAAHAQEASGWRNLDGQPVPEITVKEWFNTGKDEPTTADLRGKVYVIEFFATW